MTHWGSIEYARAGETHVAYQTIVGDASSDRIIVMVNGFFYPIEVFTDDPGAVRLVEGLAAMGTLVMFDRRGIGLSDQILDWDTHLVDQWVDDLAAVIDAVGAGRVSIFSWHGVGTGRRFAARHPDRVDRLVLWNPFSPPRPEDREWVEQVAANHQRLIDGDSEGEMERHSSNPSREDDPAFRAWQDRAGRLGASPSQARRLSQMETLPLPRLDVGRPAAPTLVLGRRPPNPLVPAGYHERAAEGLLDATVVTFPEGDSFPVAGGIDEVLAEVTRFITGEVLLPPPNREVRVVMFTDLVGSTTRVASDGDAAWRALLDRHDSAAESSTTRSGGRVVKSTGDGILALFPSVAAAVSAARGIQASLGEESLDVRTGIHVGEVDDRRGDVSGMAVHVAARVMGEAGPGRIVLTGVAKEIGGVGDAVSIGSRSLRGVDRDMELYEV